MIMKKNILFLIIFLVAIFGINTSVNAKSLKTNINTLNIVEYRFDDDDPKDATNAPGSNISNLETDTKDYTPSENNCPIFVNSDGTTNQLYELVQEAFTFIKILTPILVGVLSLVDYIKAITSSSDDEVKKATQRTIKRLVIGVLLFFLPFLLDLLFDIFGLTDVSRCGIGT